MENEKDYLVAYIDCYGFSYETQTEKPSSLSEKLIKIKGELTNLLNIEGMVLRMFSDSAFILYDISQNHDVKGNDKLQDAVIKLQGKLMLCYDVYVKYDLLLRGGISYGKVHLTQDTLIGDPIIKSARLEENGIAPVILLPETILKGLHCYGWRGVMQIPMKNDRVISAVAIVPTKIKKYISKIKKMQGEACFEMSPYSGILTKTQNIVTLILKEYGMLGNSKGGIQ